MRTAIIIGALVALASAIPHPQSQESPSDDPTDDQPESSAVVSASFATPTTPIVLTTSLNIPITGPVGLPTPVIPGPGATSTTSRRRPHWEPIPIFTKECKCNIATIQYPCWATDALQRCNYEENFSYGCYMAAAGGCPTPTKNCKDLFRPTPRPGRHPCELGPNPPLITSLPNITTLVPVVPTLNISLPALPTGPPANISLPVPLPVHSN
jgi:hypothetical protein